MNICYYIIISTLVFNVFPNSKYIKYIKLYSGFILIMIILSPMISSKSEIDLDKVIDNYDVKIDNECLEKQIMEYESVIEDRIKELE